MISMLYPSIYNGLMIFKNDYEKEAFKVNVPIDIPKVTKNNYILSYSLVWGVFNKILLYSDTYKISL